MDWEEHARAYNEAEAKADVPYYITAEGNPLRRLVNPNEAFYDHNMAVLNKDYHQRKNTATGRVYAGIMDNMRYGGNE